MQQYLIHTSYSVGEQVGNAIVRGAVYHAEGKLFSHLSIWQSLLLAAAIIGGVWAWKKFF